MNSVNIRSIKRRNINSVNIRHIKRRNMNSVNNRSIKSRNMNSVNIGSIKSIIRTVLTFAALRAEIWIALTLAASRTEIWKVLTVYMNVKTTIRASSCSICSNSSCSNTSDMSCSGGCCVVMVTLAATSKVALINLLLLPRFLQNYRFNSEMLAINGDYIAIRCRIIPQVTLRHLCSLFHFTVHVPRRPVLQVNRTWQREQDTR